MKTTDEILKIKAALLFILQSFPEGVDFIKLFKILYFAQREHLAKYGRVIVNETFHAIVHGPVPSFTYKSFQVAQGKIKSSKELVDFNEGLKIEGCVVSSVLKYDPDELSITDIKCLKKSIEENKDVDSYDLSNKSHDEIWEAAYTRAKDDPDKNIISIIEIAKSGKASEGMINYIRENLIFDRALSCE